MALFQCLHSIQICLLRSWTQTLRGKGSCAPVQCGRFGTLRIGFILWIPFCWHLMCFQNGVHAINSKLAQRVSGYEQKLQEVMSCSVFNRGSRSDEGNFVHQTAQLWVIFSPANDRHRIVTSSLQAFQGQFSYERQRGSSHSTWIHSGPVFGAYASFYSSFDVRHRSRFPRIVAFVRNATFWIALSIIIHTTFLTILYLPQWHMGSFFGQQFCCSSVFYYYWL